MDVRREALLPTEADHIRQSIAQDFLIVDVGNDLRLHHTFDDEEHEVFVRVIGILFEKLLPPISIRPEAKHQHNSIGLQQMVKLTGLGSSLFDKVVLNILAIREQFEAYLSGETFTGDGCGSPYQQHKGATAACRYFTSCKDSPEGVDVAFLEGVDPKGVLFGLKGSNLFHAEDNMVDYFEQREAVDGNKRMIRCSPKVFAVGDIVECTITFRVVPMGHEGSRMYKFLIRINVISLLHKVLTQMST
ncbi:hypothetical protein B0H10DRAFT_1829986 [Mycena sp. CBHHK59/15]|nr:hypothetical protein B0H10DRAFT_1829986 [Mycena sp. CBHHK59/15]